MRTSAIGPRKARRDEQHRRGHHHHDSCVARVDGRDGSAGDHRRHAQHQQDVGDVRADHVAQRDARRVVRAPPATETSSSGAEVPKATMVRPTISAGMPSRSDRFTAPLTSASPASSRMHQPGQDLQRCRPASVDRLAAGAGALADAEPPAVAGICERVASFRPLVPGSRSRPNMASTAMTIRKRVTILIITLTARTAPRARVPRSRPRAPRTRHRAAEPAQQAALGPVGRKRDLVAVELLHLRHEMADAVDQPHLAAPARPARYRR